MTLPPIVERELRVASRERKTYRMRWSVALISAFFGGGTMIAFNIVGPGLGGISLLSGITSFVFIFCIAAGAQGTMDCLSEEKREGTLGLLFLTDLKGYDIVSGKLAAASLATFFGLLAAFPVLAILIPIGRVQADEFFRTALSLLNVLFLSHAIGIFVSSISRKRKHASAATMILILFFWILLPVVAEVLRRQQFSPAFYTPLEIISPSKTTSWAPSSTYFGSNHFWLSLFCVHLLAWGFIGAASLLLPRVWQDKAYGPSGMRWRERFKQWCYGNAAVRTSYRRRLINKSPFLWLIARDRLKPMWVWMFLAFLVLLFTFIGLLDEGAWQHPALAATLSFGAALILKLWVASEASRAWAEERLLGTLELLLCAPLSPREIATGQHLALRRQFRRPLVLVTLAQIFVMVFGLVSSDLDGQLPLWIFGCVGYMVTMHLDLWALSWLGLWFGLTAKNPRQANTLPISRVMALPALIWYAALVVQSLPTMLGWSRSGPNVPFNLFFWFSLGIVTSLSFGILARRRILYGLRETVAKLSVGESPGLLNRSFFRLRPRRNAAPFEPAHLHPRSS